MIARIGYEVYGAGQPRTRKNAAHQSSLHTKESTGLAKCTKN